MASFFLAVLNMAAFEVVKIDSHPANAPRKNRECLASKNSASPPFIRLPEPSELDPSYANSSSDY
jgi:hypothetical protein